MTRCPVCGEERGQADGVCGACGADLTSLAPGAVVAGRYEIHAYLGRGGMGSVYRAFDRVLDEEVALKVQRAHSARGEDAERRFRSEVKLARQVSHPGVCRLHDGAQEGPLRWISMELVEGETLASRLQRGPIPVEDVVSLGLEAAEGLAAVHRAGIVHRDLTTQNLMVDRGGRLRLMDFGIAKTAAASGTAAGGYALGSPEYMSPEQARGRPADARSDVYSLGVVLFELATGGVPFRAETPVATLLKHLETAPPLAAVPEALRPVVARALAKDPADRYANGAGIAEALRAVRDGRRAPVPHRRWPRAAIVFALAATAAAAAYVFQMEARAPRLSPSTTLVATPRAPEVSSVPSPESPRATTHPPRPRGARAERPVISVATPEPTPTPTPSPPPPPAEPPVQASSEAVTAGPPTPEADGALLVVVRPWADVSVDGVPRGQTPLARIALRPGPHAVLLTHPDYRPYPRRVTIRAGETFRLAVDLATDGVRRR